MKLNDYNYEDIKVGDIYEFSRTVTTEDVINYSKLTGDENPLHCSLEYSAKTQFKERLVHGMLAASLFSSLFGMVCPGKKNLYLSQNLNFRKPIPHNSKLLVRGTILSKVDGYRMILVKTEIFVDDNVAIDGDAKIKVIGD